MRTVPERITSRTPDAARDAALSWADLPAVVLERLRGHNVASAEDWFALGRRRYKLFGVTRRMCSEIDAAIAGRP